MLNRNFFKWVSLILCTSLCFGSPAISFAAGADAAETVAENSAADENLTEESAMSEPAAEENGLSSETFSSEELSSEASSSETSSSEISSSGTSSTEESSGEEQSTVIEETSSAEESSESGEQITETETSEEDASSELSEENASAGNLLADEQRRADAASAFYEILNEKPLMALLYHTDTYNVCRSAAADDAASAVIESGHTLYITGVELLEDQIWYQVRFWQDGAEQSGYVEGYYLAYSDEDWISWEREYLSEIYPDSAVYGITAYSAQNGRTDTSDISAFPSIYHEALQNLKKQHPSWIFVPMNTGLDFSTAVSGEMGVKSLIQKTSANSSKGWVGSACPTESGWYYATRPAVEYHMNPCNFLTEEYIFQFEQLTFNGSYHNTGAIQTFLNNTFMNGKLSDDPSGRTYAQAFFQIGKNRKLSPIHLASRVYQEQGNGKSALISGTYAGYEGYYNYFNVGVNGSSTEEKIKKGLAYAKKMGWDTRFKSLEGGATTIGNNYILKGQDTIYLEKFNVDSNSPHGLYNHQYMQNIQAPSSEAYSTKRMYSGAGSLDSGFVFKIPVYKNLPGEKAIQSISLDKEEVTLYRPDTITGNNTGLSAADSLTVSFIPSDTSDDRTITWTSSNPKSVSVQPADNTWTASVTATGAGTSTITAKTQNGKTAVCTVIVEAPVYSVKLTNLNTENGSGSASAALYAGQSLTLAADYMPKDTTSDTHITWTSSNPAAASVDEGRVTAHAPGSTIITASIAGISADFEINVDGCVVTFTDITGKTIKIPVMYGSTLPESSFPSAGDVPGKVFLGWYTKRDGLGMRFDPATPIYDSNVILYPYFAEQGKGFYAAPVGDWTYTGSAIRPKVQVYDSVACADGTTELTELVENRDFTVSYKNNRNVNTATDKVPTIIIKGKGNYSGTEQVYFNILPKSLSDNDITAAALSLAYNGKVQKANPAVYRDGKRLANKTDYTLTYPYTEPGAYMAAGVYPIVVKGNKNYTGSITVYEKISKKTMMSKVSVEKIPDLAYKNSLVDKNKGIGIMPESLTVTYKKQSLVQSTDGGRTGDYTVSYADNMAVGTACVTITATPGSEFAGSKTIRYKIVGKNISQAKADGIFPKTYTGNESDVLQKNVSLTLNGSILKESRDNGLTGDYIVSYANTASAGTAAIIFKGVNEYSGQLRKTYKITGFDISGKNGISMAYSTESSPSDLISIRNLSEISSPYMKGGAKPQIRLYHDGNALVPGKDYTVSYSGNNAVTTPDMPENRLPKIIIKGKGSYTGSLQGTWTITDGAMSDSNGKLSMAAKDVTYKNKPGNYKTTLVITDANGKKLAAGKDYDKNIIYSYTADTQVSLPDGTVIKRNAGDPVDKNDIVSAGTVIRTTVKGLGAYAGKGNASISTEYRIIKTDISKAKLKVATKVYMNGKAVALSPGDITLTLNGNPLEYGTDYEIDEDTYTNNTKKGKASVVLRGTGTNFGGQRRITFTIGSKILFWWK